MLQKLTSKQEKILAFYNEFFKETGRSPTYREAGAILGLSPSVIHVHVKNLNSKGYLEADGGVRVLSDTERIPVLWNVACWEPISVFEECWEYIEIQKSQLGWNGTFYALKAIGESMVKAGIKSWDTLIIRVQSDVLDGEIGVVVVWEYADNEKATLKRIYHSPKALILKPENDDFPIQLIQQWEVRGKLITIIRHY